MRRVTEQDRIAMVAVNVQILKKLRTNNMCDKRQLVKYIFHDQNEAYTCAKKALDAHSRVSVGYDGETGLWTVSIG
jgi:hypothetical protein